MLEFQKAQLIATIKSTEIFASRAGSFIQSSASITYLVRVYFQITWMAFSCYYTLNYVFVNDLHHSMPDSQEPYR